MAGDIPPIARMVAVVDTYDAITTRPRRGNWRSRELAIEEMRVGIGRHLDVDYVEAFVSATMEEESES